jgi:hypothetical protein
VHGLELTLQLCCAGQRTPLYVVDADVVVAGYDFVSSAALLMQQAV